MDQNAGTGVFFGALAGGIAFDRARFFAYSGTSPISQKSALAGRQSRTRQRVMRQLRFRNG